MTHRHERAQQEAFAVSLLGMNDGVSSVAEVALLRDDLGGFGGCENRSEQARRKDSLLPLVPTLYSQLIEPLLSLPLALPLIP